MTSPRVAYRILGRTGLSVSQIALGCGPVPDVMTGDDTQRPVELVRHAIACGINWMDTAATYGQGRSERNLGLALSGLSASNRVHVATKVRLFANELDDISNAVRRSVEASLARLQIPQITLLQLHNAITAGRGDEPTSLTVADVLGRGGVWEAMTRLRDEGVVRFLGITAIGQAEPLRQVVRSGRFDTIQVPFNLANPTAGYAVGRGFAEADYGQVIREAAERDMGVFVIRVFAAGALLEQPPAAYTQTSPFFTLELYERDRARAKRLYERLGGTVDKKDLALRFALFHPGVTSAIIGMAEPRHIDEALSCARQGPLPQHVQQAIERFDYLTESPQ